MAFDYLLLPYRSDALRWDDTVMNPQWKKDPDGNIARLELIRITNGQLVCILDVKSGAAYFPNGFTGTVILSNGLTIINLT